MFGSLTTSRKTSRRAWRCQEHSPRSPRMHLDLGMDTLYPLSDIVFVEVARSSESDLRAEDGAVEVQFFRPD